MIDLFDTHAHLQERRPSDADLDAIVQRAVEGGVKWIITAGATLDLSRDAVALAERYPNVYATVGIHSLWWTPNFRSRSINRAVLDELRDLASHHRVVAIGQIGLDYYRELTSKDVQRAVFEAQLALATEMHKPIAVRIRQAHDDALAILRTWLSNYPTTQPSNRPTFPGALHSFSGDLQMAQAVLDLGFYLGVSGPVTFRNAQRLQSLVAQLPLDRLLLNSQCPYLTPHPYRGRHNEPAYLIYTAEKVAELKGVSVAELARVTTANAARLFRLQEVV